MPDVRFVPLRCLVAAVATLLVLAPAAQAAAPSIAAPPDAVAGEADGSVALTVRLSAPSADTVTVDYATADSTARGFTACNYDYVPAHGKLTFAPGETAKAVQVQLLPCPNAAGFRSFTFGLSGAVNATISRAAARVSIVDASTVVATPRLFVRDATVDEKDGVALVPVLLGGPPGQASNSTVTVDYATHDGTATAPGDYTAQSGTLTFAPGETVKTLAIPIADDGAAEPAERFRVGLSNPANATVGDGTGTVTIGAGDATPVSQPRISAPADRVVGEGDGYVDLAVTLSAPGTQPVAVGYATGDSTAQAYPACNYDYVGASGTLNFAPGETTKVVRVELLSCPNPARLRSFVFKLSGPVDAAIARATARVSIVDASTIVQTPRLFVRDATVDEKDGVALVPVLLGGPAGQASNSTVTAGYASQDAAATAGPDYTAVAGTLTFSPGQTVKTLVVPIADDAAAEPAETFRVVLSDPVNATIADGTGTVTIGAGDGTAVGQPAISAPPDTVAGENDGYLDLPVRLSAPATQPVSVDYATADSTARAYPACNYDYVGVSGTVNFAPGETTKVVRVELLGCPNAAGFRSFRFTLASAQNATLARASARVSIVDASTVAETPQVLVRDATVDEKDGVALVPVLLGGPAGRSSNSTVTIDYTTQDDGATAGADYTPIGGTLSFAPGQTVKTLVVPIAGDATAEPAETFHVVLSNPLNATIGRASGTVTIGASDGTAIARPAISAPADRVVTPADGYVDLAVQLSAPGTQTVTVGFATADLTARSYPACNYDYVGTSGTLTFAPGETTKVVRVELLSCGQTAGLRLFRLELSSPVDATLARDAGLVGISSGGVTLTGVAVGPANPALAAGTAKQMTATATFSNGASADLTAALDWTSSAPGVATVDDAGVVRAVAGGTTLITAGFGAVSGSTPVTVQAPGGSRTQTIAFAALPDRTYGDPDFGLSASASSGLPVAFAATGACSVSGATVHIGGAGSCTITASQPGNASTSAAPGVSRTFAIARAAQTIAFGPLPGRPAGSPDFPLSATASSGLPVAFAATGACTVRGGTVHLTGAGSCTIRASQAGDADHLAAPTIARTFTVAGAVRCRVPNVVGKKLAAARTAIARAHCRTGRVTRRFAGRRRGRVVAQSRRPHKLVAAGTKINLVVSRGHHR